ncbi:MAG: glutaredoxin domain-containing protein [Thermohalobaculum sp.]|nr:glutaredoxin domain-containing protein [Thermohalobaculum sp.]
MQIEIFTGPGCGYCEAAKALLRDRGLSYAERDVSDPATLAEMRARLPRSRSIPQVFVDGTHVGGYDDLRLMADRGALPGAGGGGA